MNPQVSPQIFALSLSLAAVRNEDYENVSRALERLRDEFCCGGSTVSIEQVRPNTVINREPNVVRPDRSES
jgi:hypothetical protein